jgi:hypothetical protein
MMILLYAGMFTYGVINYHGQPGAIRLRHWWFKPFDG